MANSEITKRAFVSSALAVLMCVVMLIGTTFAWFTSTASTAVNQIQAGTLGIQLVDEAGNDLTNTTLEFKKAADGATEAILWEPGATYELPAVYVKNNGTLALKYKIAISGIDGDEKLLEAIDWTISGVALGADHSLAAGATSEALTIKGHMQEDAGNEYQNLSINGIAITVYATQDTVEYDSTDNQYDAAAEYAVPVATAAEFAAALANGEDVVLTSEITLPEALEVTGDVTIYGSDTGTLKADSTGATRVINVNDNTEPVTLTLSGVDIDGSDLERGISVYGNADVTIVIDNCSVSADHYSLNIASENTNANVVIRNSTLIGYSGFQTWSSNTKATFENCTLIGSNKWSGTSDDYATIVVVAGAENAELTFKNCRIEANELGTASEQLLSVREAGASVTFNGCTFFVNGTEVTGADIQNNMSVKSDTVLTIQ